MWPKILNFWECWGFRDGLRWGCLAAMRRRALKIAHENARRLRLPVAPSADQKENTAGKSEFSDELPNVQTIGKQVNEAW